MHRVNYSDIGATLRTNWQADRTEAPYLYVWIEPNGRLISMLALEEYQESSPENTHTTVVMIVAKSEINSQRYTLYWVSDSTDQDISGILARLVGGRDLTNIHKIRDLVVGEMPSNDTI